ncbi:FAD-dependent oxidoreductase [Nonomuraea salmonea]|uniref:NAD(P)/FAD-dependent oxidoreductase n=1 Tax=Nonomuraea salmonea TaxID=46181 RepID=UPI0031E6055C
MRGIPLTRDFANGGVSFWYRQIGLPARRPALPGSRDYDVVIVGGGYTGLWTAYYLKRAEPGLRIAILEKEFAGFGASGRNGGWLSAEFAGSRKRHAEARGRQAMIELQRAMFASVDEVIDVARAEGIDADVHKSGLIHVATNPAQRRRLRAEVADLRTWGYGEGDMRLLERAEQRERVQVAGALEAAYSPHCARIQPAKLAVGLAATVDRLGVDIYEDTTVTEIPAPAGRWQRGQGGGRHHPRHRHRRLRHPRHRGLHRQPDRAAPAVAADEQLHDRHRAAAARRVEAHRLAGQRAA